MDNIIIKVDNKKILPLFIVLMIFSLLFLLGIIISLLYNLLGYTIYFFELAIALSSYLNGVNPFDLTENLHLCILPKALLEYISYF